MTEQSFALIPFPAPNIPEITITGKIARQANRIILRYLLAGNTEDIFLPPRTLSSSRKDELWKTTCFEFFLAIQDQPQYWEFNLSPSGGWNAYRMDAYRRVGFREETSIQRLELDTQTNADIIFLNAVADLHPIVRESQLLEVGVTAIIQTKDKYETYWALLHPASQADFHRRESFLCSL